MDFDNMIFLVGSTFIFGSGICVADDDGKLQSWLTEILTPQHALVILAIMMDQLAKKFSRLLISNSTQISKVPKEFDSGSTMPEEIYLESNLGSIPEVSSPYPLGLRNSAFIYQDLLQS
jgi:hypothetical protein